MVIFAWFSDQKFIEVIRIMGQSGLNSNIQKDLYEIPFSVNDIIYIAGRVLFFESDIGNSQDEHNFDHYFIPWNFYSDPDFQKV